MQASTSVDRIVLVALGTGILLLMPLAGMYSKEVSWTISDFAVAGALVFGAGRANEFAVRHGADGGLYRPVGQGSVDGRRIQLAGRRGSQTTTPNE